VEPTKADGSSGGTKETPSPAKGSTGTGVVVGAVVGLLVIMLAVGGALWYRKRHTATSSLDARYDGNLSGVVFSTTDGGFSNPIYDDGKQSCLVAFVLFVPLLTDGSR